VGEPPVIAAVTAVPGIQGIATIRWTTNLSSNSRVEYGTSPSALNLSVNDSALVTQHTVQLTGLTQGIRYYFRVVSTDPATGGTAVSPALGDPAASFLQNAVSIWNASVTPSVTLSSDTGAVELGMKFRSDLAGVVTGVLFYKGGVANSGTHTGTLWSSAGAPLATITFSGETASGWQQATFSNPVAITPNTTYVISYYAPAGRYSINTNFFGGAANNLPLRALANGTEGGNGVYRYGSTSGFPTSTFQSSNYWVDVIFVDNVPPAITGTAATVSGLSAVISWASSEPSASRVDFGTSASTLDQSVTSSTPGTSHNFSLPGLLASTTYYFRVTSTDVSGNATIFPALSDPPLSFTTAVPDSTPPIISGVTATPSTSSTTITWTTDEPATSRVEYGLSPGSLTSNVTNSTLKTNHSLTLTGLTSATTYYYRVLSTDGSANTATFPLPPAAPESFTTAVAAAPIITGIVAIPGAAGIATIRWTTNVASNSRVDYGTTPSSLNLSFTDTANVTNHVIQLTGLTQGVTYYFRVSSLDPATGGTGTQPLPTDPPASFRQNARSLWEAVAVPAQPASSDTGAVELGMKFRSDAAGVVTGVMFYKGTGNAGPHTGTLWTSTGTALATVTFANETATGWQQANFSTPVAITPGTTYVISYFAPNGRYAIDPSFFATEVNNVPLHALADGPSGGNGVFRYGSTSGFPANTWNSSNYWVDVLFVDNVFPVISAVTGTAGGTSASITWTSSEPSSARVDYGTSAETLNLNATAGGFTVSNLIILTGLTQSTTYYYRVSSTDTSGNVTTFPPVGSPPLSFTTTTGTPPVISSISSVPGSTSAIVTWTTDVPANSQVAYGTSPGSLSQTVSSAALVTSHGLSISGLSPGTTYHFRVTSATAGGDATISPAPPAAPLTFTTGSGGGGGEGNPPSEWDISGAGDPSIQGFTTDISYNLGETVRFKVNTTATAYRLDIYRMGYYGGDGALKVATVTPSATLPQTQPACLTDPTSGLIDCGNWAESASWTIPTTAKSGIYFAKAVRESGAAGSSHIVFVVRNDASTSDIIFQTSDTTWQAYNQYGGNSLYVGSPAGRAYKVSYNRPFTTRGTSPEDWVFNSEYPMVRWLEANGYDVTYTTGIDTDRRGNLLLNHKVFLSVGHDEYWSATQRTNVETARNAGVHLAFFSGNEIFWKTRWENSISSPATAYRTLVTYKETHANAKIDPTPVWTGTWRDPRAFNPEGANPENRLTGTIFTVNCCTYAMTVPAADGKMRFWRNTSIAALAEGQTATLPEGTLGYEWDEDLDNGARPPGLIRMSTTTVNVPERILDFGSSFGPGQATHSLTLYKHASGALVFGSGTIQWPWGLDSNHDRGSAAADVRMQQATVNLLADMGVQPATLQPGLIPSLPSADTAPPTTTITAPAAGTTLGTNVAYLITGTAADTGGVVGGVEVSVDGGTTWRRAEGRASWSYAWTTPATAGTVNILSRGTDDSGNIQTVPTSRSVTIGSSGPVITNVVATPTGNSATVTWTTNVAANSQVAYGTSADNLNQTASNAAFVTSHSLNLTGLSPGTTYFYRVSSTTSAGGSTTSPAPPANPLSFTTVAAPVITNVVATPSANSATVTWTTDQLANRRLNWGLTPTALTQTSALLGTYTTTHSRTASGLSAATTYYFRVVSINEAGQSTTFPPEADPPLRFTTWHFPASVTTVTGTYSSGNAASLLADDNNWYQVDSTTTGTRTTEWYGSMTDVPKLLTNLSVTYRGSNTGSASESVSIWNWTTSAWVVLDTRNISTTENTRANLAPPGSPSDYVSGAGPVGEVRVRIRATRTANFTSRGEFMRIQYLGP
jgi:phosphodiesterase/alkaline phosphatase D-like protein